MTLLRGDSKQLVFDIIVYTSCPYDTIDNPFLCGVIQLEEEGVANLRFREMELMKTQDSGIYFEKNSIKTYRIRQESTLLEGLQWQSY